MIHELSFFTCYNIKVHVNHSEIFKPLFAQSSSSAAHDRASAEASSSTALCHLRICNEFFAIMKSEEIFFVKLLNDFFGLAAVIVSIR